MNIQYDFTLFNEIISVRTIDTMKIMKLDPWYLVFGLATPCVSCFALHKKAGHKQVSTSEVVQVQVRILEALA